VSTPSPESNVTPAVRLESEFLSGCVVAYAVSMLIPPVGIGAVLLGTAVSMVASDQLSAHLAPGLGHVQAEAGHLAAEAGLVNPPQPAYGQNADLASYAQLTGGTQDQLVSGQQDALGPSAMTISGAAGLSASLSQPAVGATSTQAHPFADAVAMAAGSLASLGGAPGVVAVVSGTLVGMAVAHVVQAAEHVIGSQHSGQQHQWASSPGGTQVGVSSLSANHGDLPSAQSMRAQSEQTVNVPEHQETVTMGNATYQVAQQEQSTGLQPL
jgi:hypothetical protein